MYKFVLLLESGQLEFGPASAQNEIIGLPLCLLALGLGVGIVAREIDARTLETAYSINNSARSLWLTKISAAVLLIVLAECLLAVLCHLVFTPFGFDVLYRAFQSALFFLVLAMGLGALLRSELVAAILSIGIVVFFYNAFTNQYWSPLFNPLELEAFGQGNIHALMTQNFLLIVFLIFMILGLTLFRVERREVLLS